MRIRIAVVIILLNLAATQAWAQETPTAKLVDGAWIQSTKNTLENLTITGNFSVFVNAIQTAGLAGAFTGLTPVTVLAPNNNVFAKLPPGRIDTLLKPAHHIELVALVNNHILAGQITSTNIVQQIKLNNGSATLTTLAGTKLIATIDANRNILLTDSVGTQSVISRFDMMQKNGVLHTVTAVLVPATVQ